MEPTVSAEMSLTLQMGGPNGRDYLKVGASMQGISTDPEIAKAQLEGGKTAINLTLEKLSAAISEKAEAEMGPKK